MSTRNIKHRLERLESTEVPVSTWFLGDDSSSLWRNSRSGEVLYRRPGEVPEHFRARALARAQAKRPDVEHFTFLPWEDFTGRPEAWSRFAQEQYARETV